ncbi:trehalase family glycosidase [uncultured Pseudoalteromonas sp.]|uniref:MGH1-like glycoside hydrolase domain-containing protein n=1 Tax=Pseudoalteromonas sp. TaxID=53249 RepID=UPI002599586C|nr:trehalase family glycosidase [uncultured Pseudoalteromonas sp.]
MKKIIGCLITLYFASFPVASEQYPDWRNSVPKPVYKDKNEYVDLYYKAWELAQQKMKVTENLPQSPYMDEALWDDTIWIWDTAFMVLFCKYSPDVCPGVESLNNFYVPLLDKNIEEGTFPLNIQHPDNPPLFAWAEYDNYKFTNDKEHIYHLLNETQYLQKHFDWFDKIEPEWQFKSNASKRKLSAKTALKKHKYGYFWGGTPSGMDNTPRYRDGLWVDAISQQALSALYISRLANDIGDKSQSKLWNEKYNNLKTIINKYYWDEKDGFYYDIDATTLEPLKVKTPASYWPLLAEVSSQEQAKKMVEHLLDPATFGGARPWVTVARDDPSFTTPDGNYWRGGVWLPTAYMATKAIEKYGFHEQADKAAKNLLDHMLRTYKNYSPHTIWEAYSPTRDTPAEHNGERVREDFCGWSALGPISLFIENILGFKEVDAQARVVKWHLHNNFEHGIQKLRFDDTTTDIVFDGKEHIFVKSDQPYTLIVNGKRLSIKANIQQFKVAVVNGEFSVK